MFSLSFTRVVHEILAVETETGPRLRRSLSDTRPRRDVVKVHTKPVLGAGELMGLHPGPLTPSPGEALRPWGPRACLFGATHQIVGECSVLVLGAVRWGDRTAPWGPRKYVMT